MSGRIIGSGLQSVSSALFLDFDGTLIDIAQTPDGVIIPNDLVALLDNLTYRLDGALAIVTGRPIADIDRFLAPLTPVAAGIHGAELRTACHGEIELGGEPIDATVVDAVRRLAKTEVGIVVETKRVSIAVHYRLAPFAMPRIEASLRRILDDGPVHLILCPGRKVFEILPRHVSKGAALETLLALPAFRGRQPVMIGDDVSDQSAFEAACRHGGLGLKVAGEHFGGAEADLGGPAEVRAWLAALSRSLAS
jgi:trehalose 6-phosphate phosphatase